MYVFKDHVIVNHRKRCIIKKLLTLFGVSIQIRKSCIVELAGVELAGEDCIIKDEVRGRNERASSNTNETSQKNPISLSLSPSDRYQLNLYDVINYKILKIL